MQKHQIQITHPLRDRPIEFWLELDETDPRNIINECLHRRQCYESEIVSVMMRAIRPGDHVIDVGANIGWFTLIMADLVGPTGRVLAFEPGLKARKQLERNVRHNGFEKQVVVFDNPAWCRDEEVTFYNNSDTATSSALVDPGEWWENVESRKNPLPEKMQAVTLDTAVLYHDRIRLIKIDTEGGELRVLQGATKILEWSHPWVVAELNPFGFKQFGYDTPELRAFMACYGYDFFFMDRLGGLPTFVSHATAVKYVREWQVTNGLFSSISEVAGAWPSATGVPGEI